MKKLIQFSLFAMLMATVSCNQKPTETAHTTTIRQDSLQTDTTSTAYAETLISFMEQNQDQIRPDDVELEDMRLISLKPYPYTVVYRPKQNSIHLYVPGNAWRNEVDFLNDYTLNPSQKKRMLALYKKKLHLAEMSSTERLRAVQKEIESRTK